MLELNKTHLIHLISQQIFTKPGLAFANYYNKTINV